MMSGTATHSPAGRSGTARWEVRAARPEDAAAVAAAVATLLAELGGTPPARAALKAEARAHIADPTLGIVLVAAAAEELVGVLAASWVRAIQVPGRMLAIEVLWTRREWRDRGVGAALVEALAATAAATGTGRVEVGLPREGFAALRATERFYLANGFERLGPRMRRSFAAADVRPAQRTARATS
jgi:GNAT superfamily N-acetyltransferase